MRRPVVWLAWALFALSNVLHLAGWVLVLASNLATPPLDVAAGVLLVLVPAVGVVVASRHPGNSIGWLFTGAGVLLGVANVSYGWAAFVLLGGHALPGGALAAWVSAWIYLPAVFGVPPLLFLLFPHGRTMGRPWDWVVIVTATALVAVSAGQAVRPGPLVDSPVPDLENPYAGTPGVADAVAGLGWTLVLAVIALAGWSLVLRYRRSAGDERLQLRWVAFSAVVFVIACAVSAGLYATELAGTGPVLVILAYVAIPVTAGTAILRHRLYDIDVVINRTLVYGSLTAMLAGFYLGSVLLLQLLLEPLTRQSDLAVATSTLAAAALFRPARARIQAIVDRRFFRRRYDAARTLDEFGTRLRHEVDLESVGSDLSRTVRDTVQPAHVSLWLRSVP